MKDEKIEKLLEDLRKISEKLNLINDEINAVEADGEDILPGHDEGSEYHAKYQKYRIYLEQAKSIRRELRNLGYTKI